MRTCRADEQTAVLTHRLMPDPQGRTNGATGPRRFHLRQEDAGRDERAALRACRSPEDIGPAPVPGANESPCHSERNTIGISERGLEDRAVADGGRTIHRNGHEAFPASPKGRP